MLPGKTLHAIFEERAQEAPGRTAVSCAGQQITYGDLNHRADQLASKLKAKGVGPDVLTGLCLERRIEMIVAMLAILKAGGAYVPIDPAYPEKRIEFLCEDSAASVIVAESATLNRLEKCKAKVICIDQEESCGTAAPGCADVSPSTDHISHNENLAYVIYTSGSNG